jgi:hypothetical protein
LPYSSGPISRRLDDPLVFGDGVGALLDVGPIFLSGPDELGSATPGLRG